MRYKVKGNRKSRSALINLSIHPDPSTILARLAGVEIDIIEVKSLEAQKVTYLDPPFEEATPAPRPVSSPPPSLAIDNTDPPQPPTSNIEFSADEELARNIIVKCLHLGNVALSFKQKARNNVKVPRTLSQLAVRT